MFKIGDLVVYPAHGVGKIESIETRNIAGKKQDYYIMRILDNDMKIMIPIPNATAVGLRELIDSGDIPKVYEILKTREISINGGTWNRRYRGYMEKIKTGSIYELAEVLRDLTVLKGDKELSFGERKMLDTARGLLVEGAFHCAGGERKRTRGRDSRNFEVGLLAFQRMVFELPLSESFVPSFNLLGNGSLAASHCPGGSLQSICLPWAGDHICYTVFAGEDSAVEFRGEARAPSECPQGCSERAQTHKRKEVIELTWAKLILKVLLFVVCSAGGYFIAVQMESLSEYRWAPWAGSVVGIIVCRCWPLPSKR